MAAMNYEAAARQSRVRPETIPGRVPLPRPGRLCGGCGLNSKHFDSIRQFNEHRANCAAKEVAA